MLFCRHSFSSFHFTTQTKNSEKILLTICQTWYLRLVIVRSFVVLASKWFAFASTIETSHQRRQTFRVCDVCLIVWFAFASTIKTSHQRRETFLRCLFDRRISFFTFMSSPISTAVVVRFKGKYFSFLECFF
jgi:hypothetical protein